MGKDSGQQSSNPFSYIKSLWNMLLPTVAFVMGIICSFWANLPYDSASSQAKTMTHFAQFVVAVIIALLVMLVMKSRDKKTDQMFWGKMAVVALIASIVVFFGYQWLFDTWVVTPTINNHRKVLVTGYVVFDDDVRKFIGEYKKTHQKDISNWELLSNAAWNPWKIWTADSIYRVRFLLSALYVILTPFFAITIVAVAQMIKCSMSKE
jgi:uncharacterized membrane protein